MYALFENVSQWLNSTMNRLPKWALQTICLGSIAAIGGLDIWIQKDVLLFVLYLIPVGISAWSLGRQFSDFVVILCAVVWAVTAIADPAKLELSNIIWNTVFFAIMLWTLSVLLTNLRVATEVEKELLRVDPMTGAINRPFFMELLQAEYNRSQRYGYPLTLASLEISHRENARVEFTRDQVESLLADIVDQLGFQLRSNDVVARLDDY
ncbi:MAG: GGDEF domain-containing protein [Cyanobacteria bacterium P01_F01_bin.42]